MQKAVLTLAAAMLCLSACAEINKPIGPNDPWRAKATSLPNVVPN